MAQLLYRLGRFSYRRRGRVVAVWGVILVLLGVGVATLAGSTSDKLTIPGTEAQQALDDLQRDFPAASGATATLIVQAPEGQTARRGRARAGARRRREAARGGRRRRPDAVARDQPGRPHRPGDRRLRHAARGHLAGGQGRVRRVRRVGHHRALRVVSGGELSQAPPEVGATEGIGVVVAAVVLVVTFGSLVAAGMTLLTAIVGLGVGMSVLLILTSVVDITSTAPILALMLGLAVGIDYALFISSRHRNNLADGLEPEESVARAVATAGSAVTFAGATVVIALAGLSIAGIPFLSVMGFAAAGTVLTAVIVALTLLPALLGFVGKKILPRKQRTGDHHAERRGRRRVPLGPPGHPPPHPDRGRRRGRPRAARHPAAGHAAGPARRRHRARRQPPAHRVRPDGRVVRPGRERPADRRRQGRLRRATAALAGAGDDEPCRVSTTSSPCSPAR